MNKSNISRSNKTKTYTLHFIHIPVVIIVLAVLVGSVYIGSGVSDLVFEDGAVLSKSDKGNSGDKGGKSEKGDKGGKSSNKGSGKSKKSENAKAHKKKIEEVVENLNQVAEVEDDFGNVEISDEIEEVAEVEEAEVDDAVEAIEAVEGRSKWQTLLFGTDYKNLGQLRKSLVHNRNSIRKLTKSIGDLSGSESDETVGAQLEALYEERIRISQVLDDNESEFSLLGWVFRFLSGYDSEYPGGDSDVDESTESTDSGGSGTTEPSEL